MDALANIKHLAESHALTFKDCGDGHVQISGHGVRIDYWPLSRKRTARRSDTGRTEQHCTAWDAVKLCLDAAKPGIRPKRKPSTNGPNFDPAPVRTNPAGIKHLYRGERPPWEFEDFISAHSDDLRESAYRLRCEAEELCGAADNEDDTRRHDIGATTPC